MIIVLPKLYTQNPGFNSQQHIHWVQRHKPVIPALQNSEVRVGGQPELQEREREEGREEWRKEGRKETLRRIKSNILFPEVFQNLFF